MNKLIHRLKRKWYKHTIRNVPQLKFSPESLKEEGYVSQYGQDKYINENFFKGKESGVFIDIGANQGCTSILASKVLTRNKKTEE